MSDIDTEVESLMRASRRVREKNEAFIASQPQSIQCPTHPEQTLRIDLEATMLATIGAFGDLRPGYARCPACVAEGIIRQQNERLHQQGVPSIYTGCSFDNWVPRSDEERRHLETVQRFAQQQRGFLIMLGSLGTGKTHLSVSCLRDAGRGRFTKQNTMLRDVRKTYRDRNAPDPVDYWQRVPLLIVDEMGLSVGGKDELPTLHEVLDHRHGERKPTILTANLDWDGLKQVVDARLADRLKTSAFAVLNFSGPSYRGEMRQAYFDDGTDI